MYIFILYIQRIDLFQYVNLKIYKNLKITSFFSIILYIFLVQLFI